MNGLIDKIDILKTKNLNSGEQERLCRIIHRMVDSNFILPPPHENENEKKSDDYEYLWRSIHSKYNIPFYQQRLQLLKEEKLKMDDNKKEKDRRTNQAISKIFCHVENEFEKRINSQPVFLKSRETRTMSIYQTHPSDLAFETIQMSSKNMNEPEKNNLLRNIDRVDLTKEISLRVTTDNKERKLENNKDKFLRFKNNPFF